MCNCCPIAIASFTIVRNLYMRKTRPSLPTRRCPNSTGRPVSTTIATATAASTGLSTTSPPAASTRSETCFTRAAPAFRTRSLTGLSSPSRHGADRLRWRSHAVRARGGGARMRERPPLPGAERRARAAARRPRADPRLVRAPHGRSRPRADERRDRPGRAGARRRDLRPALHPSDRLAHGVSDPPASPARGRGSDVSGGRLQLGPVVHCGGAARLPRDGHRSVRARSPRGETRRATARLRRAVRRRRRAAPAVRRCQFRRRVLVQRLPALHPRGGARVVRGARPRPQAGRHVHAPARERLGTAQPREPGARAALPRAARAVRRSLLETPRAAERARRGRRPDAGRRRRLLHAEPAAARREADEAALPRGRPRLRGAAPRERPRARARQGRRQHLRGLQAFLIHGRIIAVVRVAIVDPASTTPPYDHSLASALARRGHSVDLLTSPFPFGPVPAPDGYRRDELFLAVSGRILARNPRSRARFLVKGLEYLPSVRRLSRRLRELKPDVVHVQWLALPRVDVRWLQTVAAETPTVFTAHHALP